MRFFNGIKDKITGISDGVKSGAVYALATLFSRGLAMLTLPLFTRIMTPGQIGVVTLYNSWYALLSVVATLSLTSGGFQVMMKEYPSKRNEYQSSVLTLTSVMAVVLATIYFCAPDFWNGATGLPTELMVLLLLGFLFAPAREFWLLRQRYEYKYKLSALVIFGSALLATLSSVAVVLWMGKEHPSAASGRLYANYVVLYGVAAVIWFALMGRGKTFFHREFWVKSLQLSLPLIGYSLAAQILNTSDRVMIGQMIGDTAVGIYGTLATVASLSQLVWSALNSSYVPYLYRNMDRAGNTIKKTSATLLGGYALVCAALIFLAPEIVRIFATEEYYEAIYIMPPIAAGIFLNAVSNLYSNVILYYKKTVYIMLPCVIAAVVNVALNLALIPSLGYVAAAYTTLFAHILLAVLEGGFVHVLRRREEKKRLASKSVGEGGGKVGEGRDGVCDESARSRKAGVCDESEGRRKDGGSVYDDRVIFLLSALIVGVALVGIVLYSLPILRYLAVVVCAGSAGLVGWKYFGKKKGR